MWSDLRWRHTNSCVDRAHHLPVQEHIHLEHTIAARFVWHKHLPLSPLNWPSVQTVRTLPHKPLEKIRVSATREMLLHLTPQTRFDIIDVRRESVSNTGMCSRTMEDALLFLPYDGRIPRSAVLRRPRL